MTMMTTATKPEEPSSTTDSHRPAIMSAAGAHEYDPDAEFVYDYQTLRIGGLTFVAVIMILSVLLLASNKIRQCGKPRQRKIEEVHLP
nr:sodium/potassium-transporting ATPase subunit gamma-like [Oncorhynchus nerka]